ncbi:Sec-independent protein translocase subunit TatA [Ornithinimicrobium sp. Y1847]|uniref:Sec-independent protein translocase subunit TatA n=1 Tax=unclassified Ornithinimicrobium TaxID=2615080 RepID=UPI003B677648
MGGIKLWHIIVLIIAFVLLFGWKNLPNAARSLGESMRVFKTEVDQMKDDSAGRKDKGTDGDIPKPGESIDRKDERYEDTAQEEYRRLEQGRDSDPRA